MGPIILNQVANLLLLSTLLQILPRLFLVELDASNLSTSVEWPRPGAANPALQPPSCSA